MLFDSGLCTSCDAAVKRGTASVAPVSKEQDVISTRVLGDALRKTRTEPGLPIRRRGLGRKTLTPAVGEKPKRKYTRRAVAPESNVASETNLLESLRNIYAEDLVEAEKRVEQLRIRVEVADEILERMKKL